MKTILLAMLAACLAIGCTPARAFDQRLAIFDAHAAASRPSRFSLPDPAGGNRDVTLLQQLPGEIRVDGEPASVFLAEIDGKPGTIVRLGDTLDIALDAEERAGPGPGHPLDREFNPSLSLPGLARGRHDTADGGDETKEIDIWIFLHDTSGEREHARFVNWYVSWWLKDMEENVKPGVPVRASVHSRVPGLTDMDYHAGRDVDGIRVLAIRGADYARSKGARITSLTKFVLFVDAPARNWASGTLGGAIEGYGAAIASNRGHRHIFAHEVGHLLGARHEDAEHRFFCITNMKDSLWGVASCRDYSKANDENIRRYVRDRARNVNPL